MSMQGLRNAASNINNKGDKKSGGSAFYKKFKIPQISAGAGMGKDRITFDLRPYLSAPPSEESKTEAAEPCVLIAGEYEDPYAQNPDGTRVVPPPKVEGLHFRVHAFNVWMKPRNPQERGFNTFRDLICSSGPEPHAPQPCLGCHEVDHGKKDSRAKDQWAFNIAHLGWYHNVPLVKDGVVQMKRDNSGPVMIKQECLRYKPENAYLGRAVQAGKVPPQIAKKYKDCEACAQGAPYVWGEHRLIQIGFKHLKNILEIDDKVGKKCINCGTNILRIAFDCESCGGELLDVAQAQWTNDQLDTFSKTPTNCHHCSQQVVPKAVYDCGYDENYNQIAQSCGNPQKTTIFDCVLWLQREGESMESEVVVKRVELISQYKTQDNRPLSEHLKEIVKAPFDLVEMYKAESLDDQARIIQVENPYAQQRQQFQSYGGQPNAGYPVPGQPAQGAYQPPGYAPPVPPSPQPGPQQPVFPGMPMPGRPDYNK